MRTWRAALELMVYTIAFAASMTLSTLPAAAQVSQSSPVAATQDPFPETTGKPVLLKVCGNCHAAETVIQNLRTRQEWSDVIDQMARFGAEATDLKKVPGLEADRLEARKVRIVF